MKITLEEIMTDPAKAKKAWQHADKNGWSDDCWLIERCWQVYNMSSNEMIESAFDGFIEDRQEVKAANSDWSIEVDE